jgi:pimeloyl-ACP methyl ester carboxylesterase
MFAMARPSLRVLVKRAVVLSASALLFLLPGCFLLTRVAVDAHEVGPEKVQEELNVNALTGKELSTLAREALVGLDLEERFEDDPEGALAELHAVAARELDPGLTYALAELSFAAGKRNGDRGFYLAAAVYAYLFLLGDDFPDPNPYDRRFRWACDLYNRGLALAFTDPLTGRIVLQDARCALPQGTLDVALDRSPSSWSGQGITDFLAADGFDVRGLSLRYRRSGLGVALIGLPRTDTLSEAPGGKYLGKKFTLPITAFLELTGGLRDVGTALRGTLHLRSAYESSETQVGDRVVPLEADLTAPLAYGLGKSELWQFSLGGFFGGDSSTPENGLIMVRPYKSGRIPVVLVHGTASNPAYWAEMFNTLQADPELGARFQFWFFLYNTGSPIAYSAATLRDALFDVVEAVDPGGQDAALRRMVVIGHSQGGLLARLMATEGGASWWEDIVGSPLEEFEMTEEQRKLVLWALDFHALPFVERVVFMSTPHRGSFLTKRHFAGWISSLIEMPGAVVDLSKQMVQQQEKLPPELVGKGIATSVNNMDVDNPFLKRLGRAPIAPGVAVNSIVAVKGDGPVEEGNDGVVEYVSAHFEGAESELVVRSGHSSQLNPLAIREVRRILLEHLRTDPQDPETSP